jgi:CubicO group peptidase (beta-lactamase class C family)
MIEQIKAYRTFVRIIVFITCWIMIQTPLLLAQSIEDSIDHLLVPHDRSDAPGLAVGVIQNGHTLYAKGWGMADLEHNIPITPDSVFDIASVSKQFTGLAIAILESQNKLNLHDPIKKHIKGLPDVFEPVRLRHLLHHTSGIRDWPGVLVLGGRRFDDVISFSEILNMARRQQALSFPPGEMYSYSNTGYNLLARIVETTTKDDFSDWIHDNILNPLEMVQSHFHDDLGTVITNRVRSYQGTKKGPFRNVGNQLMALGSSSLYSTVNDLLKWIRHFEQPTITTPSVIEKTMQPGSLNHGESSGYAYGFRAGKYRGTKRISHSGGWAGFRTYLLYLPEFKLGIVVLSNWSGMNTSSIAHKIAAITLGNEFSQNSKFDTGDTSTIENESSEIPASKWKKWRGTYTETGKTAPTIRLFKRNSKPWIRLPDGTGAELRFKAPNTFFNNRKKLKVKCASGVNDWPRTLSIQSPGWAGSAKKVVFSSLNPSELNDYTGVYYSSEMLTRYRLEVQGENLRAIHHRHHPVTLERFAKDCFTSGVWYWSKVDFDRDLKGKVTGLRVTQERNHNMVFLKQDPQQRR